MFKYLLSAVALLSIANYAAAAEAPTLEEICAKLNNLPKAGKPQKENMKQIYAVRDLWEPPLKGMMQDLELDNVRIDKCTPIVYLNLDSWHVPAQVMTAFVKGTSVCYVNDFLQVTTLTFLDKEISLSTLMGPSYEYLAATCFENWGLPPFITNLVESLQTYGMYALFLISGPFYEVLGDIVTMLGFGGL